MTGPRPIMPDDTAVQNLPPLHRILTPEEFHQARQLPAAALASRPFPVLPPMAPRESTRTGAPDPNPGAHQLTGVSRVASDVFQMGSDAVANPMQTVAGVVTAPITSAFTLGRYLGQKIDGLVEPDAQATAAAAGETVSGKDAALAGVQAALVGLAGPLEGKIADALMPIIGAKGASVLAKMAAGAGIGASYDPSDPAAGAIVGAGAGGIAGGAGAEDAAHEMAAKQLAKGLSQLPPEQAGLIRDHLTKLADAWNVIFDPAARSPEAGEAAGILRATTGASAAEYEQAAWKLDGFRRLIDPLPDDQKLAFIDNIEGGKSQLAPEFQAGADQIRQTLDDARDQIRALGTGKLEHFIENYFPHIWTDPDRAADLLTSGALADANALQSAKNATGGKRPMEGSKSFLKQRTIPTTAEGMAQGLKPVSLNPVDLTLLKLREMQRYLMAHQSLAQMKDAGLVNLVPAGELPPDGHAPIQDKIATVLGPPTGGVTIPEGSLTPGEPPATLGVRDGQGRLRSNLSRVSDEDLQTEWLRLAEHNSSEEALHSAVQEANYRAAYNNLPNTERLGSGEDMPDASGAVDPDQLATDNKTVSDYRRRQIVRAARDKAMKRIESEMQTRPSASDFNFGANQYRANGGLPPGMRLMKPSDVQVFGRRIMGQYYAPEPVARIVNNYLSPGLRGNAIYDAYRGLGNALNQAQLGLSAFHLGFTSLDAAVSRVALGVEHLAAGRPLDAVKEIASAPLAPVTNALLGKRIRAAYLDPDHATPDMQALANAVKEAGGRVRQDSFYQNSAPERMMRAMKAGAYGKAAAFSIPAAIELASRPLMEHIVPMQKLGVFGDLAQKTLAEMPEDASLADRRAALQKAWDSVDNRMGQLVYDNLFWSKTFKDLSMASVRSVGWNLGTFRELGGGTRDLLAAGAKLTRGEQAELTHRAAYLVSLPMAVGMAGAAYQYLRTGQGPQELKDYFFPRTGEMDADGNAERVQFPSYMKDVVAYAGSPVGTLTHKVSPIGSMLWEMLNNQNFYGDEVRNPHDPFVQQLGQEASYVAQEVLPFSLTNMLEQDARGDQSKVTKLGSWFGVTPAPRSKVRSDAENRMQEYMAENQQSGATPEQEAARQSRSEILSALRGNQNVDLDQAVNDAVERHGLTPPDIGRLLKRAGLTPAQEKFKGLTLPQALDVFQRATPAEKAKFAQSLLAKIERSQQNAPAVASAEPPAPFIDRP